MTAPTFTARSNTWEDSPGASKGTGRPNLPAPAVHNDTGVALAALGRYARALGLTPRAEVCDLLRACTRSHPSLQRNWLCSGPWPIEASFAETDPDSLRIDAQPGNPALSGAERVGLALRLAGISAEATRPWAEALDPSTFGAFVSVSAGRTVRRRVYLELGDPAGKITGTRPELAGLLDMVPGLRPHLLAIDDQGGIRWYLKATGGLALLELFAWGEAAGLAPEVPALLDAVRRLAAVVVLPPDAAMLAVGSLPGSGIELKVELTAAILRPEAPRIVEQLLVERPAAFADYRRWRAAVPGAPTVISARIATGSDGVRCNVYSQLLGGPG